MRNVILIITLLFTTCLTACKNNSNLDANNGNAVNFYSDQGELIVSIQNQDKANAIRQAIETCEKAYEKILPFYKHYIELTIDNKKQTWLISNMGYIKRKDTNSTQMYKVKNPKVFSEYLK